MWVFSQVLRLIAPDFGGMEAEASRLEGGFRHSHSRLAKHAESVAFCGGGAIERAGADERFEAVCTHGRSMNWRKWWVLASPDAANLLTSSLHPY